MCFAFPHYARLRLFRKRRRIGSFIYIRFRSRVKRWRVYKAFFCAFFELLGSFSERSKIVSRSRLRLYTDSYAVFRFTKLSTRIMGWHAFITSEQIVSSWNCMVFIQEYLSCAREWKILNLCKIPRLREKIHARWFNNLELCTCAQIWLNSSLINITRSVMRATYQLWGLKKSCMISWWSPYPCA